jgi:hypothetical protein
MPHSLALLETHKLLQQLQAFDALPQAEVHDLYIVNASRLYGDPPWLAAVSYLQVGTVLQAFSLHLGGAMSFYLTGAATGLITKLIGSTNT